jgi:putative transposase
LAVERYRALEPHLIDGVTLAELARASVASERTLQRWLRRYRVEGLSGLGRSPRSDRGKAHMPDHLIALVRELTIKRPRPPDQRHPPQGSGARHCRRASGPQLFVRLPHRRQRARKPDRRQERSGHYRDHHELVHRREASASNEIWQADHTVLDILVLDACEEASPSVAERGAGRP